MGHNIRKPWLAFKSVYADPRLAAFDPTVSALNKFERIRYPDEVLSKGMIGTFDLLREHESKVQAFGAANPPTFALNLENIDELVTVIFEVAKMNPHFYLNSISEHARAVLNDRNRHPFPPAA